MTLIETIGLISALLSIAAIVFGVVNHYRTKRAALTMKSAFVSAERVLKAIERAPWRPDVVVGIGRSGALFGGWFAGNLGSLPIYVVNRWFEQTPSGRRAVLEDCEKVLRRMNAKFGAGTRILVVEGATTSGTSFLQFEDHKRRAFPLADYRTAALYVHRGTVSIPSYYAAELVPWPDEFPWHARAIYKRYMHGNQP